MSKVIPVEWIQRETAYGASVKKCNLQALTRIPSVAACYEADEIIAGYKISKTIRGCKYFIDSDAGYVDLLEDGEVVETEKSKTIFLPKKEVSDFGRKLALELYKINAGFEDVDITEEMKPYVDCFLAHDCPSDIFYAVIYQAMKEKERGA